MPRPRRGDLYAVLSKIMGRPVKVGTKLKKPPKPKSVVGGGGRGGSTGGGRPRGGGRGRFKSGGGRPKGLGKARGRSQAPKGVGESTNKARADSKNAQKAIDQALEQEQAKPQERDPNLPESGPGSEGGRHGLRKAQSAADAAEAARRGDKPAEQPQDLPPQQSLIDEPTERRAAAAMDRAPSGPGSEGGQSREVKRRRERVRYREAPQYGSREKKQQFDESGEGPASMPSRPVPSTSTEAELGVVQQAISTPKPEDVEILMTDPQKYIGPFIDAFGEDNVPPEAWSILEAPTGDKAYPYPAGVNPPSAPPPPPMIDPFYGDTRMSPAPMESAMPPMPKGNRMDVFLPEELLTEEERVMPRRKGLD